MRALNLTSKYRADLEARNAAAREARAAEAARARDLGSEAPPAGRPERDARLWNAAGHWAMIFCIWFAMLALVIGAAIVVLD